MSLDDRYTCWTSELYCPLFFLVVNEKDSPFKLRFCMENNEVYELDDITVDRLVSEAFNIIQESIQIDLENGNITEKDINEFNQAVENDSIYQGIIRPPMYNWSDMDDNLEDILNDELEAYNYAEVYIARPAENENEIEHVFAVVLLKINNTDDEQKFACLKWNPEGYAEMLV